MNKFISTFIILLTIISISNPIYSNDFVLTQEIYSNLCGIWDIGVSKTYKRKIKVCKDTNTYMMSCGQMSWGMAEEQVNVSLLIDLGSDRPFILFPAYGEASIKKITKISSKVYIIRLKHYADKVEREIKITLVADEKILINEIPAPEGVDSSFGLGNSYKDNIFTKTDAPVIKYFKPISDNLRFRSEPSSKGNIIRLLKKEDKLLILMKGKNETIEGSKGHWVKVLTDKNEIGWCFDVYLQAF